MLNDFFEKTVEDIIFENKDIIHTRGFMKLKEHSFRQVYLPSGKKIDILGLEINNGNLFCDIYELKKKVINADAICQAYNYYTELKCITRGYFASFDAQIIMVGKTYEPVSVIDALPVKIKVYSYDYKMDGIRFKELHNSYEYSAPNRSFSFGIWAKKYANLTFKSSISFHSAYDDYSKINPEFDAKLINHTSQFIDIIEPIIDEPQVIIKEIITEVVRFPKTIKTEVFPEQPQWSLEFSESIPHYSIYDDLQKDPTLDCDLEDDELGDCDDLENDLSDFEMEGDFEESYKPAISGHAFRRSLLVGNLIFLEVISKQQYFESFKIYI